MTMRSILIVEDEFIIAMLIEKQVRKLGYHIAGMVTSGEQAIEQVKKGATDLVLMDIKINGGLDGIETMQEIRRFSDIPVIYITGNSDSTTRDKAEETSPTGYIIKPIDSTLLRSTIELALNGGLAGK
jgi:two-component system, response regulator PdtaR